MNILIIKKNIGRFFLLMLCMLTLVVGLYAAIEFSEGYQICKVTPSMTWQDLEAEFSMPADIIAQYNHKTTDMPFKEGMRIKIPNSYKVIVEERVPVSQNATTLFDDTKKNVTVTVGKNQVAGTVATITADGTEIRSLPNGGGVLLYDKTKKGMTMLVTGENATYYSVLMGDGSIGWVAKISLKLSDKEIVVDSPTPLNNNPFMAAIIETAKEFIGTPYKYGGKLPDSVDCSLLVQTVFAKHGMKLPRTAAEQSKVGMRVEKSDLQMGDRIYFYNPNSSVIGHTGIYISDDRFIHASSNRGQVAIDTLSSGNYPKNYAWSMR